VSAKIRPGSCRNALVFRICLPACRPALATDRNLPMATIIPCANQHEHPPSCSMLHNMRWHNSICPRPTKYISTRQGTDVHNNTCTHLCTTLDTPLTWHPSCTSKSASCNTCLPSAALYTHGIRHAVSVSSKGFLTTCHVLPTTFGFSFTRTRCCPESRIHHQSLSFRDPCAYE